MIGEWLSDIRAYFAERLKNPVLAPFSVAWVVSNWKLVFFMLSSDKDVEDKIVHIESNYMDVANLLVYPAAFALAYALLLPWAHLWIEELQDKANLRRRMRRLASDTKYLMASVENAEAKAKLNWILAKDEATRRAREELDQLAKRADAAESEARAKIEAAEEEYNAKLREYEAAREADSDKTEERRRELEDLKRQLKEAKDNEKAIQQEIQAELERREAQLGSQLATTSGGPTAPSEPIPSSFLERQFTIYEGKGGKLQPEKAITFERGGQIGEGKTNHLNSWRIRGDQLELLNLAGEVHTRLNYSEGFDGFIERNPAGDNVWARTVILPGAPVEIVR